jgi:hypothetical protein
VQAGVPTVGVCDEAHLRATIAAAGDPGVVTFACSGTITLASTLTVTSMLELDATGQDITLSGNDAVRVLRVDGGTLTLTNLTVANGTGDGGGGIANFGGTVTLTDSTVSGNTARTGGGIANSAPGTVVLADSVVRGNTAGGMDADCSGGGIIDLGGNVFGEGTGCLQVPVPPPSPPSGG